VLGKDCVATHTTCQRRQRQTTTPANPTYQRVWTTALGTIRSDPEPAVKARPGRPRKGFKAGGGSCCPTATTGRSDTGRGPGVAGDGCCCTAVGGGAARTSFFRGGDNGALVSSGAGRGRKDRIDSNQNLASQPDVTYGVDMPDAFYYLARAASELALCMGKRALISSHNGTYARTPLSLLLQGRRT
jgi:hypothetical protein